MQARMAVFATTMLCALCAAATPEISSVSVRQQWPWSAKITVDFHLANDEATPVDVSVAATNGGAAVSIPLSAVTGPHIGLTATGDYRLVIDPAKISAGGMTVLGDFSVTLSLSASRADRDFALYRIYRLSDGDLTEVTVKALLNGEWGDIETDYSFAGGPYLPDDEIIWTGVTNNIAYKTTHLVMRYAPAGSYTMLAQKSPPGTTMTLTDPFYVGVFEMTQGQCAILNPSRATAYYTNAAYAAARPMGSVSLSNVRGENSRFWPDKSYSLGAESYIGRLRTYTGESSFDLPTCARWEYASRAGCGTRWYNGATASIAADTAVLLGRGADNGGLIGGTDIPAGDVGAESGTAVVGSYLPNSWGIYDTIGNVAEICLDRYVAASEVVSGGPYTDYEGSATAEATFHVVRGGNYSITVNGNTADYYDKINYANNYASGRGEYKDKDSTGFRVVCSATAAPAVSAAASLGSATGTAAESVVLAPDASPFWRTAKTGVPVDVSIDWPDGAASATFTLSALGRIVATQPVTRTGSEKWTAISIVLPTPVVQDDERVYSADVSFADGEGDPIVGAARTAQFAAVLGYCGARAVVCDPGSTAWTRYRGTRVALPVAAGVASLAIDGVPVDTGLNGAEGWYGAELSGGTHTLESGASGVRTIYCHESGIMIIAQ